MPTLKFYADTKRGDTNKLFRFRVNNLAEGKSSLERLKRSLEITRIRAAWVNSKKKGYNVRIA